MTVTPVAVTSPGTTGNFTGYVNDDPATGAKQDTGNTALGVAADAASATGSLHAKLRAIATALGTTALDLGSGTGGSRTLRTYPDTAAEHTIKPAGYSSSAAFTPAASSHTAGDCNGAAGTFASIGPSAGAIMIASASLSIDGGTAEATAWRLYLYSVTPPSAYADDAAWDIGSGDRASFLGFIDLGTAVDLGATQYVEVNGLTKIVRLAGTSLFGYLVNLSTLTPAAVAHNVKLHAIAI